MPENLISVLLPVYNTSKYLRECLDSILLQSEKCWELLAVDDFSTDESRAILEEYAEKDNRVKVFKNTEKGLISALRLAYAKSSGNLITRMDSDDRMTKGKLAALKQILLNNGKGNVATGLVKYISEKPLGEGYKRYEKWLNTLLENGFPYTEVYKECVIPSPCWMLHREDLERCGAFASDTYPEDYDLCFRMYDNDLDVIASSEILHYWRDYPTRTSRTDEKYANPTFLDLKLHYFLKIETFPERPLVLWGAAKKGKTLAKGLIRRGKSFRWICDNPNKWGKNIFGVKIEKVPSILEVEEPHTIIAIANEDAQAKIRSYMDAHELYEGENYTFFC